ncbi:unnamed protein product [Cyclocybe aegerita]|uniref:NAD-dependent epimerase/dehydratase domain-containing protein n=1 Tax=Cyclocybe aegerita TaxID=1973307 RepID=A0A8S0WP71_CYCAE|nr:unnamed protein product [Cyclocybe aegerita]
MPIVPQGGKVLVSGANGYIAMWTVKMLLERGYRVRGTVRSENKGRFLNDYFAKLGHGDAFEFAIVEDFLEDDAFDEVIKDVDAIAHMASPVHSKPSDPDEILKPAVRGTIGILKSALKNASRVRRIVVTSSTATIITPDLTAARVFSEEDWNEACPKEVKELGAKARGVSIYRASKVLAERAAWDFYKQHKSQIQWDLTVINPPFVFGPPIHDVRSPKSLNLSLLAWYQRLVSESPEEKDELSHWSCGWVDVRDTALAHVMALEKEAAGGERIMTPSGRCFWQEWINAVNSLKQIHSLHTNLLSDAPNFFMSTLFLARWTSLRKSEFLGSNSRLWRRRPRIRWRTSRGAGGRNALVNTYRPPYRT